VTENRVDALLVVAVADMAASIDSIIAPTGPVSDVLATGIETYIDRNLHLSIAKGMPCAADANSFRVEFEGDKINFEGTPVSYTPKPFVMVMEKGALLTKAAPARKPPVRRKPQ